MNRSYRTKHRITIEDYLERHADKDFSVAELHAGLKHEGEKMGLATIYRQVANLLQEGYLHVLQTQGDEERFHYLHNPEDCADHYHLKCTYCGKLVHLHCKEVDLLTKHMKNHHGFSVEWSNSLLYGKCKACTTKE